jgi:hypothetical protein
MLTGRCDVRVSDGWIRDAHHAAIELTPFGHQAVTSGGPALGTRACKKESSFGPFSASRLTVRPWSRSIGKQDRIDR